MNQSKNKIYMLNLCFELTRKCNLQCCWCSNGDAQNIDITKEIIDKTLNEVQGFYIEGITFYGGEPMLNSDMFLYLSEQIVRKKLMVRNAVIFSNGTIQDAKVKKSLLILSDYFSQMKNTSWMKDIDDFFSPRFKTVDDYKKAEGKNVTLILSTSMHNNKNIIDKTYQYYNIDRENTIVLKQRDKKDDNSLVVAIEGRAEKTWKTFFKDKYTYTFIHNKYCFINDKFNKNMKFIEKKLTISANGNVFVGASASYNHVDAQPMFNILDCDNDFYEKVDKWCWKYPVNRHSNKYRKLMLKIEWCEKHGIKSGFNNKTIEHIKIMNGYIDLHEQELIKHHKLMPNIGHIDLNTYATFNRLKNRLTYGVTENQKNFLKICGGFDKEYIESLNLDNEKVLAICNEFERKYNKN